MKRLLSLLLLLAMPAMAAEPLVTQVKASAAQIMEAASQVAPQQRQVIGNTITFKTFVTIDIDSFGIFPVLEKVWVDGSIVAKDNKFKVELANALIFGSSCENHPTLGKNCEQAINYAQETMAKSILIALDKANF